MIKYQKYFTVFNLSASHAIKNYKALIGLSIFLMTCLVIFAHLWKIAAAKVGVVTFDPDQLLWYIAFNEWLIISIPTVEDTMEQDLRSGRLAYLIPRPISYLGATFADACGVLCVNLLVLGIVSFTFTWMIVGSLPFQPLGLLISIIFGLVAGCVAVIFQMLIGLSAFWLQEAGPFHWLWEKLLFMFGGLILPLAVYPAWMQTIAFFTPFPAILGDRSALALDFSAHKVFVLASSLTVWGLIGIGAMILLYRKGLRILNIEGG